ncbi:hypothetical protein NM208_g17055 [Fusarium decemcellulare]|uniref:Uncharacterized protein n=1 Tax=Fusarium decemcellulare TaxID=57161 RepID=A0ACC1R9U7_9HYPO|nr:hypothetical protein NM208_g17055 [Fusarium decemcellulare]
MPGLGGGSTGAPADAAERCHGAPPPGDAYRLPTVDSSSIRSHSSFKSRVSSTATTPGTDFLATTPISHLLINTHTSSIAGYTIYREEPNDAAPDLSNSQNLHPLGEFSLSAFLAPSLKLTRPKRSAID